MQSPHVLWNTPVGSNIRLIHLIQQDFKYFRFQSVTMSDVNGSGLCRTQAQLLLIGPMYIYRMILGRKETGRFDGGPKSRKWHPSSLNCASFNSSFNGLSVLLLPANAQRQVGHSSALLTERSSRSDRSALYLVDQIVCFSN